MDRRDKSDRRCEANLPRECLRHCLRPRKPVHADSTRTCSITVPPAGVCCSAFTTRFVASVAQSSNAMRAIAPSFKSTTSFTPRTEASDSIWSATSRTHSLTSVFAIGTCSSRGCSTRASINNFCTRSSIRAQSDKTHFQVRAHIPPPFVCERSAIAATI